MQNARLRNQMQLHFINRSNHKRLWLPTKSCLPLSHAASLSVRRCKGCVYTRSIRQFPSKDTVESIELLTIVGEIKCKWNTHSNRVKKEVSKTENFNEQRITNRSSPIFPYTSYYQMSYHREIIFFCRSRTNIDSWCALAPKTSSIVFEKWK